MLALRPSVVYHRGNYHIIGPITKRSIYHSPDRRRAYQVRDLFVHFAPELLDPEDAERTEVFADSLNT